jgi:hypothetical protein
MVMELKAARCKRSELWLSIHDLSKISHQARCAIGEVVEKMHNAVHLETAYAQHGKASSS